MLDDVHPGVLCWMHWFAGWPAFYASIAEMPPEVGRVFRYLVYKQPRLPQTGETGPQGGNV